MKTNELIAYARKWIKLHRENEYQREAAKIMTSVVDALEAATRVPVQGKPQVYLFHEDGTPKSNDEIRHEAAVLRGDVPVQGEPQWVKDNRVARDLVKPAKVNPATVQGEPNDDREALAKEVLDLAVKTRNKADRWANTLGEIALGDEAYAEAELLRQASVVLSRATVPDAATEFLDAMNKIEAQKFDLRLERDAAVAAIERVRVARNAEYDYTLKSALHRILVDYDAAGFSRAAVPDAETDRLRQISNTLADKLNKALTERDAATAAVERVRAIHRPVEIEPSSTICGECSFKLPNGRYFGKVEEWPCPTIAALDGAPEPERETEGVMYQARCGSWDCRAPECGRES